MVEAWVKDLVESKIPNERITNPKSGEIVFLNGDKIEIIDGQYWGEYGVSNFWSWYRLDDNEKRLRKESGYGNFYKTA